MAARIDMLQLGSNMLKVSKLKDDPLVFEQKFKYHDVEQYFIELASTLKDDIIE